MSSKYTYAKLLEDNAWIRKSSDSFYWVCATRTVQESKLFPVNSYIALSYYNCWYRYPQMLRKIDEAMPAEEIGTRAREVSGFANALSMGLISQFYMLGRQFLIDMGMINPTDGIDDIKFVLDFARRVNLGYHRQNSYILSSDDNNKAQILPERTVQVFEADALGCKPGDKLHTAVVRFLATATTYAILKNCECRLGIHNSGPYKVGSNEMLVRDFVDLGEGDYPWLDGVAAGIEFNNMTLPVIMKDTHFSIVDDVGSFEATPAYDPGNVIAVGAYTSDYLSNGYIPVHMDNASEMADYLNHMREAVSTATSEMWKVISGWTRDQMIDAGLMVYYATPKNLAHIAGVYEQDDWFTIEDRVQRFKPIMNDEYGRDAITELVGYMSCSSQQNNPYNMNKWTDGPNDMWSAIPYTVLQGNEWTSTVGPIRGGTSSLPKKTEKYTTTRGKLTQDECNRLARDFTPDVIAAGSKYNDDSWIKYNYGSPEADALYNATQQNSPSLKGKGAGLTRDDIAAIRAARGEQPLG